MKKIILHACCAPCASYPIKRLVLDGFKPVVFFVNPNIYPYEEYKTRRDELIKYCALCDTEFFEGEYDTDLFYQTIKGTELEMERGKRCGLCFYLRFQKTAQFALNMGIDCFTTTLSVSPHKNSKQIFEFANKAAKEAGVRFIEYDFKKNDGFKISRQIARENNMYAQTYCGCRFSIRNKKIDQ